MLAGCNSKQYEAAQRGSVTMSRQVSSHHIIVVQPCFDPFDRRVGFAPSECLAR